MTPAKPSVSILSTSGIHPSLQESLAAIVLDSGAGGAATLEDGLACVEALRREDRESLISAN